MSLMHTSIRYSLCLHPTERTTIRARNVTLNSVLASLHYSANRVDILLEKIVLTCALLTAISLKNSGALENFYCFPMNIFILFISRDSRCRCFLTMALILTYRDFLLGVSNKEMHLYF